MQKTNIRRCERWLAEPPPPGYEPAPGFNIFFLKASLRWFYPPPTAVAMWELTPQEYLEVRSWSRDLSLHHVWLWGSQWRIGRRSTNIMEPCELMMYPCILCPEEFRSQKELDNHNRVEYVGKRAIPCSICGNEFYYQKVLSNRSTGVLCSAGFC